MSFHSGLLGASITLMGAVSLSTPDVMQIHETQGQHAQEGNVDHRFDDALFETASADSRNTCLNESPKQAAFKAGVALSALIQVAFIHLKSH